MNNQTNTQATQDTLGVLLDVMSMHKAFGLPLIPTAEELAA